MYTIATLTELRQHTGADADDARLLECLQAAAGQAERITNRHFCPRIATRSQPIIDPDELILNDDLLHLTAITLEDGSTLSSSEVLLLPTYGAASMMKPRNGRLLAGQWADVSGIWGWHDDWALAWRDSGDVVTATLNASATDVIVSQADGADSANEAPRLQVGHLLRIDDEYLRVVGVTLNPSGADTLKVQRGVQGSTAAAHDLGAVIETYQPAQDVVSLVLRWATWLYREPDQRINGDIPFDLLQMAASLRRDGVLV